jgi:polyphosphate kinase 2 (PPK2 family)
MLEALDLSKKLPKSEYRERLPPLQRRLLTLQRLAWEAELATIIVVEGWGASGKGKVIEKLTQQLEPRGFSLHVVREPRTVETHLPWMWRFWVRIPNWGEMAIFDRSWYWRVVRERLEGDLSPTELAQAYRDITDFERALTSDRYQIVKFFLHLSKNEQRRRFEELEADPHSSWRVEPEDWHRHERYARYLLAFEEMLEHTETEWCPWHLVEATDARWERFRVFEVTVAAMERELEARGFELPDPSTDYEND